MAASKHLLIWAVLTAMQCCSTDVAEQQWLNIERDLADVSDALLKKVWPLASELVGDGKVSVSCTSALFKMFSSLKRQQPWVIKMLLANGFMPSNILEGGVVSLGGYERCLHTVSRNANGDVHIKGQYCSLFLQLPRHVVEKLVRRFNQEGDMQGRFNPLIATADTKSGRPSVRIGICTPSACTVDDLNVLVSRVLQQYGIQASVNGCRCSGEAKVCAWAQVFSIAILSMLVFVVLVATALEKWSIYNNCLSGPFLKMAKIFSAVSNTKSLLKTENTGLNQSLLFLSGLKVFSAYWVLLDHEYIALQAEFLHSPFELMRLSSKPWFQFITNGVLSVSTFFFMSGFALSISMAGSNSTIRSFCVAVARRYIRLTFPVMVVVLMAFLLPLIADGPADSELLPQQLSGCYANWWALLVHSNDFLPQKKMCLTHLWYVAADMQIFVVVALPMVVLLNWNTKASLVLAFVTCVTFGSMASVQTYFWHLFHGITFGNSDVRRFSNTLEYIHFKPFVHIPTYVCGTVSGFLCNRVKETPLRQRTQALCWLLSACLLSSVMFVTNPWNDGRFPAESVTALYGGFHRLVWALGPSWPFIACATGRRSFFYKFLAWKAFLPLSRLTYGIYLTHLLFHLLRMANTKTPINVDEFLQLRNSIGTFGFSVALAYLLYIICDGPTQQIGRLLFKKTATSRPGNEAAAKPCAEVVSNGTA